MFTRRSDFLVSRIQQLERIDLNDSMKQRHFTFGETLPHYIVHKENLCLRVVHQMMYVSRFEFMKKRNRNGAVSKG